MAKTKEELREARKQWFAPMEQKLKEMYTKEDDRLYFNKLRCRKMEQMMPSLMKMVEREMEGMRRYKTANRRITESRF